MMPPHEAVANTAADSARVDVQVGILHGDVYYVVPPESTAEEKFEIGVRRLDGGMREPAWQLISEVAFSGHLNNKVCFYWYLALLSGRTRHELSDEEAAALRTSERSLPLTADDSWADGVRIIRRLLCLDTKPLGDVRILMKEFDQLRPVQRALILRHLEMTLDRELRVQLWERSLEQARAGRMAGDREGRVWMFFQAEPRLPRMRPANPVAISGSTWVRALLGATTAVAAAVYLAYVLAAGGRVLTLILCLTLSGVGGYLTAHDGAEWRFRSERRWAKDELYLSPRRMSTSKGGFAHRVDQRFEYYFAKYVPRGTESSRWLAQTAGIRQSMRDEVVEVYRESAVVVEEINWLIRHRAQEARSRAQKGTLWSYREDLATPWRTRVLAVLGLSLLVTGLTWASWTAVPLRPLPVILSAVLVTVGGWIGGRAGLRVILERRRFAADRLEAERLEAESTAAFERWKTTLAAKPKDGEMAAWLDCDRKLLLDEVLQYYRLTMHDVISHAFIEAPTRSSRRARVRGGPWRHRRYELIAFVLTTTGVRQLTVTLDFDHGTFNHRRSLSYRFANIASVRVEHHDNGQRAFELALLDGQKLQLKMIESDASGLHEDEDPRVVANMTLEAAGLLHTLHVLEGVAADGREWLQRDRRRGMRGDEPYRAAG
ncbi:hypothetical protein ACIBH1_15100 [Nonomuraea sp. NPDC050663]|uniref:hypothetical protein n=1 Tax=Nonomuraea sp. NPDC050663 TaxID=3364370 RepID=UPI003789B080